MYERLDSKIEKMKLDGTWPWLDEDKTPKRSFLSRSGLVIIVAVGCYGLGSLIRLFWYLKRKGINYTNSTNYANLLTQS